MFTVLGWTINIAGWPSSRVAIAASIATAPSIWGTQDRFLTNRAVPLPNIVLTIV
ncbi:MAG: hypothetical protein F6K00_14060 [Leptolyngbya sp. SIOISBB]|nr:hypothetical protein [Leptolyngbya sp. SIOISBB]